MLAVAVWGSMSSSCAYFCVWSAVSEASGEEDTTVDVTLLQEETDVSRERFTMLRCAVECLHTLENGALQ